MSPNFCFFCFVLFCFSFLWTFQTILKYKTSILENVKIFPLADIDSNIMTPWRDCQDAYVFLYNRQLIVKYPDIITTNPEFTLQCLRLLAILSFFYCNRTAESQQQPTSWRSGSNGALGKAEPRGIQRLRLFRQYLQRAHRALQAVNTNQLSPECIASPTELTAGQLGVNLGTDTQEEGQGVCAPLTDSPRQLERSTHIWLKELQSIYILSAKLKCDSRAI